MLSRHSIALTRSDRLYGSSVIIIIIYLFHKNSVQYNKKNRIGSYVLQMHRHIYMCNLIIVYRRLYTDLKISLILVLNHFLVYDVILSSRTSMFN